MSQENKQFYMLLTHRVESVSCKDLIIQVTVANGTPNITRTMLEQASRNAIASANNIHEGIEVTACSLIARIDLGHMTESEFMGAAAVAAAEAAEA